ncbi:MAG: cytochrome c biogenesis protein ResB, partial [Pseudomonadota bacterium]
ILGTVAQRYIGLYESEKLFFGSFILWVGAIPLPGAYSILGLFAVSLALKLLFKSKFTKRNSGIIIAHASSLILLAGGLITSVYREEGYIVLENLQRDNVISDYYLRELSITKNGQQIGTIGNNELQAGTLFKQADLPFEIEIKNYCYQCNIVDRSDKNQKYKGLAEKFDIVAAGAAKNDAGNQSGVVFEIKNAPTNYDGTYIGSEILNKQPEIIIGKDSYKITIQAVKRTLPFNLKLLEFEKREHPGTEIAKSYRSRVSVIDGKLDWKADIEMNSPLRYRGYTIYQSSFINNGDKILSVLAVVKNVGEIFPYLAVISLCIGLVIHLLIIFSRTTKNQAKN